MRYIVLEEVLRAGWIPTWSDTGEDGTEAPVTFASVREARTAVREHRHDLVRTRMESVPGRFHVVPYVPALHDAQWREGRDQAS